MTIVIIAALLGLIFGGLRGLIVGALLGYGAAWAARHLLGKGLSMLQSQYLDATFAVMGALAKADDVVTRDEIDAAERLFDRLRLSSEQREAAKAAFNRGKQPDFDLDATVAQLAQLCRGRGMLLQMFLQAQLMAIGADGQVDPSEHEMLVRIARGLGLAERDVAQLEALLRSAAPGPSSETKLEDAYAALGLEPSASDAEIKRTYRRLMNRHHPDKLVGRGLPDSMRELAEEKTREISTAYRLIREARGTF